MKAAEGRNSFSFCTKRAVIIDKAFQIKQAFLSRKRAKKPLLPRLRAFGTPMPLNDPKIQELLKPLRLEQKKDFNNRAVSGGLDQYVMRGFAALLKSYEKKSETAQWLEKTRSVFGQYMALSALS